MLESVFNDVAGLQLSCEYYEIFKNSFFHETPAVAAFDKFENFPGDVLENWRSCNKFIFLVNIAE